MPCGRGSGGVAIRYVLPVLRVTSSFAVVGRMVLRGRLAALWYRTATESDVCESLVLSVNNVMFFIP